MITRKDVRLILLFCLLGLSLAAGAQGKKELEQRKAKIQKEIDFTNKQLQLVAKSKTATTGQLEALRKKIRLRQEMIGTINSEINALGSEIKNTESEIKTLQTDLEKLKASYAEMIRFAYANRNITQQFMFVFAADDFNQAYRRIKYLQQYSESRRRQALRIGEVQTGLSARKVELEAKKNEKTSLRNSEQQQKQTLESEKKEQDQVLKNLTVREQKLRKDLADKKAAKQKLDRAIESLIRKEIESAKAKAAAAGKKNVTTENVFSLTPEAARLSNSFSGNKGTLPWPVEVGTIVSTFGEHPHKELKNIMIQNNGVDIHTTKGAGARAIFDGTVSGVISIPGSGRAVIIRHGEYLSVYSNLQDVSVKTGDKVSTRQRIGTVGNDSDDQKGEIHLEIWKSTTKMNPSSWLARK